MVNTKFLCSNSMFILKCYKISSFIDVYIDDAWTFPHFPGMARKPLKQVRQIDHSNWTSAALLLHSSFVSHSWARNVDPGNMRQAVERYDLNWYGRFKGKPLAAR